MTEEWRTLAQQIAGLKAQLETEKQMRELAQRQLVMTQEMLSTCQDLGEALLDAAEKQQRQLIEVIRERDMYKAAYELQDIQSRTQPGDNNVH